MRDRDAPYGNYSEAIPMDELIRLTHKKLAAHADYTDEHIHEYAKHIVETELCPCVSTAQSIIDALVIAVLRDVNR